MAVGSWNCPRRSGRTVGQSQTTETSIAAMPQSRSFEPIGSSGKSNPPHERPPELRADARSHPPVRAPAARQADSPAMKRNTCARCRGPLIAIRSTRKYCCAVCRQIAYRQRRALGPVELRECVVEPITKAEAAALILRHEHLGTLGRANKFYGLRTPTGRLIGALGFGPGPLGGGACCTVLERGCCVPGTPPNAPSYLIGRALRHGRRVHGWRTIAAYSDSRFGEAGIAYRAAGFKPYPSKHGKIRYGLVVGGAILSDRSIYRKFGSHGAARDAGAAVIALPARQAWQWCP